MKIITFNDISNLNISPKQCIDWASYVIKSKNDNILPPKISIPFGINNNSFFNTMPSYIPELNRFGVKIVSRIPSRVPSITADILLYDSSNGALLSHMDGTWITTMRTGAVAALSINQLQKSNTLNYSFIGLGNTDRATLLCLNEINNNNIINVNLLAYKNQHELFQQRFANYKNIQFNVYENINKLIQNSDVIISCVTTANSYFAEPEDFKPGCLVVPIHTRGFQNCDLSFDKIFCDDINHISHFKNFNKYKYVKEMTDVLNAKEFIREDKDRILVYNIGISLQDIYFASKIYELISHVDLKNNKFWV